MSGSSFCKPCEEDVVRAALAYLRAVDSGDDDAAASIVGRWDRSHLASGLVLVALSLLVALREHKGCPCGSPEWLEEWALLLAGDPS